ncbi:MAG TPA: sigma-54 dependent transcriptional regulator [Oligoflexia bacterium]|nr:sigma-54 dependent transcriptional regulator [Oligoflexia bacterium]HMP48327.1 sigma-54 dependent transcriptional regulator [Oligoflexia bacterium]
MNKEAEIPPKKKSISFPGYIGQSEGMKCLFDTLEKIIKFKTTVLIVGESGTGKELFAKSIHKNSDRKSKPFIAINCGAIPEHLIESELFGHKKGSFTDATRDKKGLFEEASGGTIFLDEIGELPVHLQAKLLRVLQENQVRPVGSEENIPIDVRVIAATLRDLEQDTIDGRFRDDLFFRLNVVQLTIPPLRERKDEIPSLVDYLLKKISDKLSFPCPQITQETLNLFSEYHWPGNIRELENYLERAIILSDGSQIEVEHLPEKITKNTANKNAANYFPNSKNLSIESLSIKEHTRHIERYLIEKALEKTGGNRTHAAKLLEISHRALLYKLKEYELESKSSLLKEKE